MSLRSFTKRGAAAAAAACALVLLSPASPASAASTNIDHVQPDGDKLQLIVSVADLESGKLPDLGTVTVSFDGDTLPATAQPVADAGEQVRRTTVLAMDVSKSMDGAKFKEAKAAADAFLDAVPK